MCTFMLCALCCCTIYYSEVLNKVRCYTDVTQMLHRCYTDVTDEQSQMLHRCYTDVTQMLHRCYTDVTQLVWSDVVMHFNFNVALWFLLGFTLHQMNTKGLLLRLPLCFTIDSGTRVLMCKALYHCIAIMLGQNAKTRHLL